MKHDDHIRKDLAVGPYGVCSWLGKVTFTCDDQEGAPVSPMCKASFPGVYADENDGDHEEMTVSQAAIAVGPGGNDQTWNGVVGCRYRLLQFEHQLQRSLQTQSSS